MLDLEQYGQNTCLLSPSELGMNGVVTKGAYTRVMEFEDALNVAFSRVILS